MSELIFRGPQQLYFMHDDITPTPDLRASTSMDPQPVRHLATEIPFTLQQKAYLMTILEIEDGQLTPEEQTNVPTWFTHPRNYTKLCPKYQE